MTATADPFRTAVDEWFALNGDEHDIDPSLVEESPFGPERDDTEARCYEFVPLADFVARPHPQAEPLLGKPGQVYLATGSLMITYGEDGASKSTWMVDGVAHLAAGRSWLGLHVPRPVRFCVIELEGPPALFAEKLEAKADTWDGDADWTDNVFVYAAPWGEFSFASPSAREALNAFCDEHAVDVVAANPTLGLGVAGSGKPDETEAFVARLVECGLKSTRAFWLLHHENKAGQISGDWGRHADTKVQLQKDGNQPRTKLIWEKTRWATLPTDDEPKSCLLEWVTATKSYTVVPIEPTGASDNELEARIANYLAANPLASTTAVTKDVQGTNERIRDVLQRDRFDCVNGPRGAKLWMLSSDPAETADGVTAG